MPHPRIPMFGIGNYPLPLPLLWNFLALEAGSKQGHWVSPRRGGDTDLQWKDPALVLMDKVERFVYA